MVINGKTVQICYHISQLRFNIAKNHPLRDAAFDADCLISI